MALTKTQKWLLILTPVTLGVAYLIYTTMKKGTSTIPASYPKKGTTTNVTPANNPNIQISTSDFPLAVGSGSRLNPNQSVMTLQDALGVTIDGIFGKQTLAALQSQTGLSQITDANQLAQVVQQIEAKDAQNNYSDAINAIFAKMNSNPNLNYLNVIDADTWQGVSQDANGNWVYNGQQKSVTAGQQFPLSTMNPDVNDTGSGKLVLQDTTPFFNISYTPTSSGSKFWLADPTNLSVS